MNKILRDMTLCLILLFGYGTKEILEVNFGDSTLTSDGIIILTGVVAISYIWSWEQ